MFFKSRAISTIGVFLFPKAFVRVEYPRRLLVISGFAVTSFTRTKYLLVQLPQLKQEQQKSLRNSSETKRVNLPPKSLLKFRIKAVICGTEQGSGQSKARKQHGTRQTQARLRLYVVWSNTRISEKQALPEDSQGLSILHSHQLGSAVSRKPPGYQVHIPLLLPWIHI